MSVREMPSVAQYTVQWSFEDAAWVATTMEFPSLSWLEKTPVAALEGLLRLVHSIQEEE